MWKMYNKLKAKLKVLIILVVVISNHFKKNNQKLSKINFKTIIV